MEALRLDPAGYSGSYKLIGGRLSLDLVNTISWPGTDREHDWLKVPANVGVWLNANGLESPEVSASDLEEIYEIRKAVNGLLRPLSGGEHPDEASVNSFNSLLGRALRRRRLDSEDLAWTWTRAQTVQEIFDPVILDGAELAAAGDHDRLRHCPSCDWLFEDQTRNGRRRWCDMADCGSRAKARSYYHRHKE